MSWTERQDTVRCCPGHLGVVSNAEPLARLKVRRVAEPLFWTAFNIRDLYPPTKRPADNDCGTEFGQDGFSVDRASNLSLDQLHQRSEAFASLGKNRVGDGAFIAPAGALRAIRVNGRPNDVVYKIYDDAIEGNSEHAVIRGCEQFEPEERTLALGMLQELFEGPVA